MLSILAVAMFCTAQGNCTEGFAEVASVTQCAQFINEARADVYRDDKGQDWYMVASVCHVEKRHD